MLTLTKSLKYDVYLFKDLRKKEETAETLSAEK